MKPLFDKTVGRHWALVSLILILAAVAVIGSNGSGVTQRQTIEVLVNVVLVTGLYVFAGNTGVLSFGQMSFMSVGAYTAAIVSIPQIQKHVLLPDLPGFLATMELSPVLTGLAAGLVAVVFALILVVPITRLGGLSASLAMFAVLVITFQVASNWDAVTRGSQTMLGVPTNTTITSALIWSVVVLIGAYAYQRSAAGLRVRATREDEFVARSVGISIPRERAIAFILSAFIVGIGGFLYAQFIGAFTPSTFYVHITFLTIAMLIVGGQNSLAGAVVGAVLITELSFLFGSIEDGVGVGPVEFSGRDGISDAALAIVILLVLAYRRQGIMNGKEFHWPPRLYERLRESRDAPAGGAESGNIQDSARKADKSNG